MSSDKKEDDRRNQRNRQREVELKAYKRGQTKTHAHLFPEADTEDKIDCLVTDRLTDLL